MMETPNLMDVPTNSTRRIERYGVLALILFLTTFGVLYLWDREEPVVSAGSTETARVDGSIKRYHPKSTARPPRNGETESARSESSSRPPISSGDDEQRHIAEKQRLRRAELEAWETESSPSLNKPQGKDLSRLVRHFNEIDAASVAGLAPDVSVSGYSGGKRGAPLAEPTAKSGAALAMEYIVKSGDCLSVIAERQLGSIKHLDRLREVNGLRSDSLRLGQRLILPHIGATAPVRAEDLELVPGHDSRDWVLVTVQEGDSLWKIAARELDDGSRYDEIMAWNDLKKEMLQPGTKLRIRKQGGDSITMRGAAR